MSGDCALRRGDKVRNHKTHESGEVITSDGLTVAVTAPDGQPAHWAHADVEWAEGAFASRPGGGSSPVARPARRQS
jgi:hypothetical protein